MLKSLIMRRKVIDFKAALNIMEIPLWEDAVIVPLSPDEEGLMYLWHFKKKCCGGRYFLLSLPENSTS